MPRRDASIIFCDIDAIIMTTVYKKEIIYIDFKSIVLIMRLNISSLFRPHVHFSLDIRGLLASI
jgi:hypothetical protein